jgi:hypothetical protein
LVLIAVREVQNPLVPPELATFRLIAVHTIQCGLKSLTSFRQVLIAVRAVQRTGRGGLMGAIPF